jgi:hypothetical protein
MRPILPNLACFVVALSALVAAGGEPAYKIEVKDNNQSTGDILLPLDPTVRIQAQHSGNIFFGLTVNGNRITCSPQGSIWPAARIDGQVHNPAHNGNPLAAKNLPADRHGKARQGFVFDWKIGDLACSQLVEIVPGKPYPAQPAGKRKLDTCRITYVVHNQGQKPHEVAWRTNVDILVVQNDGALFASPTTAPGKILNGVALEHKAKDKEKELPAFLQVLEQPNLAAPGFVAIMTLKFGARTEGPNKIVLTQLGAVGAGAWDVAAVPAGDSACAIFWEQKTLKPGEKREMVWAYGGGIAMNPEGEGKVSLALGGNLEPGKMFSLAALVEDPVLGQTLRLELPPGVERVEGEEIQPVLAPADTGNSIVLWKGRILRPGAFDLKVHSSTGMTHIKSVSIQPVGGR